MQPTLAGQIHRVANKIISGKQTYIVTRFFFDRFLQTTTQSIRSAQAKQHINKQQT